MQPDRKPDREADATESANATAELQERDARGRVDAWVPNTCRQSLSTAEGGARNIGSTKKRAAISQMPSRDDHDREPRQARRASRLRLRRAAACWPARPRG